MDVEDRLGRQVNRFVLDMPIRHAHVFIVKPGKECDKLVARDGYERWVFGKESLQLVERVAIVSDRAGTLARRSLVKEHPLDALRQGEFLVGRSRHVDSFLRLNSGIVGFEFRQQETPFFCGKKE